MAHTPGPWTFEGGGDRHITLPSGESLFCDTQYYPWCSENSDDWRLIAAAPELLEACKAVYRDYESRSEYNGYIQNLYDIIEKAEGRDNG